MRKITILTAAVAVSASILGNSPATYALQGDPEPRSIAGKCNKEVGGYYNTERKQWVIPARLVAAKNACVTRMLKEGK